jgi:prephenate dehydratase
MRVQTNPCFIYLLYLQAVELWLADKAVLPIENSSGGSIHRNYDLLLRHRLHIVGEVQLASNLCLLALPGVRAEQLTRVLSHPQVKLLSLLCVCVCKEERNFFHIKTSYTGIPICYPICIVQMFDLSSFIVKRILVCRHLP